LTRLLEKREKLEEIVLINYGEHPIARNVNI
jgi:hypothetical protein